MSIDNETFDFGEVEWKQPGKARFNITNTGDKPLVINEVIPDCACSVAQWTTAAIAPNDKGVIEVVFDAKALGSFHKSIAILSNAEELKYIHFKGKVVEKLKDYSKTHPYVIDGLRNRIPRCYQRRTTNVRNEHCKPIEQTLRTGYYAPTCLYRNGGNSNTARTWR